MHSSNLIFLMPPPILYDIYGLMIILSIPYFFSLYFKFIFFKFLGKLNFFSTFPCSLLQINHFSLFYIFYFWRKIYPKVKVFLSLVVNWLDSFQVRMTYLSLGTTRIFTKQTKTCCFFKLAVLLLYFTRLIPQSVI